MLTVILSAATTKVWCGPFGIEEKIALENSLSKKIEEVAVKMLGDKNIIVMVNIEHNTTIEQEVKKIETAMIAQNRNTKTKNNYLPGIPMDALESEVARPDDSLFQTLKLPQFVKSISVTLIVSDRIPDEKIRQVKEYITELLNLNFSRGDRLGVKKMPFAVDPKEKKSLLENTVFSQLPWIIGLLIFIFFIFGPLRSFMKNILTAIEVFRIQADTRVITRNDGSGKQGGRGGVLQNILMGGTTVPGVSPVDQKDPSGIRKHFDFVNESNLKNLIYLLKAEPAETIAIVMAYLPKETSTLILDELPEELRIEALQKMATITQYSGEDIKKLESTLKEKVEYLLGGPQSIADLINSYDQDAREKILADIEMNDPGAAYEIRKILITFEDLMKLKKEHIYEIFKAVGTRLLAAALKNSEDDVKNYVLGNLTPGARDMVKQEMELIPDSMPEARIKQARKDTILAMQKLQHQGIITLNKES